MTLTLVEPDEATRTRMRSQRSRDTSPELLLRRDLRAAGVGYRVHHPIRVPGWPRLIRADVALVGARLAVFVDGRFWHRHPCQPLPQRNAEWWDGKLATNALRDRLQTFALWRGGWRVVRVWEGDDREQAVAEFLWVRSNPLDLDVVERLAARTEPTETGCWVWLGSTMGERERPYGKWPTEQYETRAAHRVVYTRLRGPVPEGLELDHLCRRRLCVNPWHLEAVTRSENQRRGATFIADKVAQTECVNGHLLTPDNVYDRPDRPVGSGRMCRACRRERVARYEAERRANA